MVDRRGCSLAGAVGRGLGGLHQRGSTSSIQWTDNGSPSHLAAVPTDRYSRAYRCLSPRDLRLNTGKILARPLSNTSTLKILAYALRHVPWLPCPAKPSHNSCGCSSTGSFTRSRVLFAGTWNRSALVRVHDVAKGDIAWSSLGSKVAARDGHR
ncbi:hypothetical protein N658DRAFT_269968 [Parathielavia hyrcaniae]|uniref:Uncharacterized protein n=1 Tax=Parathielavia hyrcaniae TaxID=113614 RepID=A0AAN6SY40_9PEZI|nr:hypothetical protein N658DRAFT_269968 [Parathielavia hyrcaniae]